MDYIITNSSKKLYIRLDDNGYPITCDKRSAQHFENSKARNILDNLPKKMKKFHFRIMVVPKIVTDKDIEVLPEVSPKVLQKDYVPSKNITRWIEKFGMCDDILMEAKQRKEELLSELSNVNKEFTNIIHQIELEDKVNMYIGWQERNEIKANREKRRIIKDELMIVENVLRNINTSCLKRENIKKAVDGLSNRKYTFRVVEENE